ncbi:hypothetical protein AQUCO_02500181v1 [Aquilegia coerulea]|uniref:RING-type domain-containing protein n=1 Tax=Aquilegia coerulea TaxID=218851 RepID=A0A2G5D9W3_AQUCA|nr:hypothetical protein AQUCO_02500181v1 [Aquilegia coerulea]
MSTDSVVFAFSKESAKDFGKKKRINRSAKLKQCKLDARREQWLSQVKNKGGKEELVGGGGSSISSMPVNLLGNSEAKSRGKDIERLSLNDSDMESSINSSIHSILGSHDLCKDSVGSSRGSSISSISGGCYCESGEEEEEEEADDDDDGCADDWETVADALTASDKQHHSNLGNSVEIKSPVVSTASKSVDKGCEVDGLKAQCDGTVPRVTAKGHAWRPDDAFRPQSLPTLSKQYSFPMNAERCCGRGAGSWIHSVVSQPTSCPICYEDLDLTDSSFRPCLCGFRLCLFCHKRILEADGRCPGCRKQYESAKGEVVVNGGPPPFRFTRSFSMSMRS